MTPTETALAAARALVEVERRFMACVSPEPNTGCWLWTASTVRGYGQLSIGNRRMLSHRAAWLLFVGDIPAGMFVCHSCDNGEIGCCNPGHLWLGDHTANMADAKRKGRLSNGRERLTHCPKGHPYDKANTLVVRGKKPGQKARQCRACVNARHRRTRRAA